MKLFRLMFAGAALLACGAAASAQQATVPPAQGGAPGLLPKGKIALIDTRVFPQQIGELRAKLEGIGRKFEPRVKELQGEADKINALENTVKTQAGVLGAARIAEMSDEIERRKKAYQRKAEDLEAEEQREQAAVLRPFNEKLSKFAEEYTKKNGIGLLVDAANAFSTNTLVWVDPRANVTEDFIKEYNKVNPAPAAATPAPATPAPQPAKKN